MVLSRSAKKIIDILLKLGELKKAIVVICHYFFTLIDLLGIFLKTNIKAKTTQLRRWFLSGNWLVIGYLAIGIIGW